MRVNYPDTLDVFPDGRTKEEWNAGNTGYGLGKVETELILRGLQATVGAKDLKDPASLLARMEEQEDRVADEVTITEVGSRLSVKKDGLDKSYMTPSVRMRMNNVRVAKEFTGDNMGRKIQAAIDDGIAANGNNLVILAEDFEGNQTSDVDWFANVPNTQGGIIIKLGAVTIDQTVPIVVARESGIHGWNIHSTTIRAAGMSFPDENTAILKHKNNTGVTQFDPPAIFGRVFHKNFILDGNNIANSIGILGKWQQPGYLENIRINNCKKYGLATGDTQQIVLRHMMFINNGIGLRLKNAEFVYCYDLNFEAQDNQDVLSTDGGLQIVFHNVHVERDATGVIFDFQAGNGVTFENVYCSVQDTDTVYRFAHPTVKQGYTIKNSMISTGAATCKHVEDVVRGITRTAADQRRIHRMTAPEDQVIGGHNGVQVFGGLGMRVELGDHESVYPLYVKQGTGQTRDSIRIEDSAGATTFKVESDGDTTMREAICTDLTVDTDLIKTISGAKRVGIKKSPNVTLDVGGQLNIDGVFSMDGVTEINESNQFLVVGGSSNTDRGLQCIYITAGPISQVKLSTLYVEPNATTEKLLILRGLASQTGDLFQWQATGGTVLGKITAAGDVIANTLDAADKPSTRTNLQILKLAYAASQVTQTSTDAPVVNGTEVNNAGSSATWSYTSAGSYTLEFGGDIASGIANIFVMAINGRNNQGGKDITLCGRPTSPTTIQFEIAVGASFADDLLEDASIFVYTNE